MGISWGLVVDGPLVFLRIGCEVATTRALDAVEEDVVLSRSGWGGVTLRLQVHDRYFCSNRRRVVVQLRCMPRSWRYKFCNKVCRHHAPSLKIFSSSPSKTQLEDLRQFLLPWQQ
jgi:hypothetical protein